MNSKETKCPKINKSSGRIFAASLSTFLQRTSIKRVNLYVKLNCRHKI